ncbi:peptidylprolyl isomerase [Halarcobacter bivalviorum]|uniref:Major antigenic peptide / PpiC-type peptidyl-prolyl cis-trans isomerase n=1 Tax=Halarcobacter bivalviorum TaxID=663364 RepID=A0AAX2A509_9BACT|nr:peptidyl-prolyl cis-trans isomerase [Halarcobacter bivalviorum]AXH13091.1 major antigenic peptide / PpiC-type peptidyl-prolyl cis-trans isomerase [Halarcobacter bivalviorum]RXK03387.1 peptidylprolyl isomerase [Halarcobacter bivalviorum]RXK09108.1 peptidylprolyl isomerase [Halarcobacter bivalviorum]
MIKVTSKKLVTSLIATVAITTSSLCASSDVLATVNGDKITKQDIAILLGNPNIDFDSLPKKNKNQILDQIINNKLLTEKAVKSGVEKDAEYKESLEKLKKDLALRVWLKKESEKVTVSEKDMKDYYEQNKAQFKVPATLEARHILVKTEAEGKEIIKTLDKASNKKDKFVELAKTKSVGPTGPQGGYLGKFPETKMVKEFSDAANALKVGNYSKSPVKTQFGYHVIYLEDKEAAKTLEYDKIKNRIKQVLLQEKFRNFLESEANKLRDKAKIVIKL